MTVIILAVHRKGYMKVEQNKTKFPSGTIRFFFKDIKGESV